MNIISQFRDITYRSEDASGIESFLSLTPRPPLYTLFRQSVIYSKQRLSDSILNINFDNLNIELINKIPSYYLQKRYGENEREIDGVITFLPTQHPNIYRLTTISKGDFWRFAVRRLVNRLYPAAMPVFFKQVEIRDALLALENELGSQYRVRISEATLKLRREIGENKKVRIYDTHRYWTQQPIKEVFESALEKGEWFTGLKLIIDLLNKRTKVVQRVASCRIYNSGEIHYDFLYSEISNQLLPILELQAAKRLTLFDNRGIRERNYQPGPPLEISYKSDLFSDKEELIRFAQIIGKYKHASKAIYHDNPYYHASVADFLDGSSFEIWVLSQNRIVIVPQAKSSEQALERLISHIFFEYREGEISELKEQQI